MMSEEVGDGTKCTINSGRKCGFSRTKREFVDIPKWKGDMCFNYMEGHPFRMQDRVKSQQFQLIDPRESNKILQADIIYRV